MACQKKCLNPWLQRLPQQVQAILIATKHELEEQLTDRIRLQMCYPLALTLSQQLHRQKLIRQISQMSALLDLETRLSRDKSQASRNSHRRNCSRSQSESKLCWYHWHFGGKVTKCIAILQLKASGIGKLEAELSLAADNLAVADLIPCHRHQIFVSDTGADVSGLPFLLQDAIVLTLAIGYSTLQTERSSLSVTKIISAWFGILSCFSMAFHNMAFHRRFHWLRFFSTFVAWHTAQAFNWR